MKISISALPQSATQPWFASLNGLVIYCAQRWVYFLTYDVVWESSERRRKCDKFNDDDPHEIEVLLVLFFNGEDYCATVWQSHKVLFMIWHPIRVMKWENFHFIWEWLFVRIIWWLNLLLCDFCFYYILLELFDEFFTTFGWF